GDLCWRRHRAHEGRSHYSKRLGYCSSRKASRPFRLRIHQRATRSHADMRSPFFIRVVGRDHSLPAVARARRARFRALSVSFVILVATVFPASANPVSIGSKKFTESYVLGEMATGPMKDGGVAAGAG